MTGTASVYDPTMEGFDVYIRWVDHPSVDPAIGSKQYPNPLTVATAEDLGLYLRWTALQAIESTVTEEPEDDDPTALAQRDPARDYAADDLFQLSPNPASIYLTINTVEQFDRFELVSITGAVLTSQPQTTFNIEGLSPGTYFVRAFRGDRFGLQRFVKQ
ncbi:T9SS type A sorting domain-containing protein [Neolewinella maritima]|nr:T9SS type A sorting domain-containing protein [Neolewinella maritima]